ncbi:hypothetical protein J7E50_08480 [Pedobacter sp. ISL-68]|uniref:hypothetical protein n=1 Tax=unclassified Pedobacter TaxID=2628915 RepID=UPI001BE5B230|nr:MULTISPECIES: hypothetical protein [unclassified Pedobacter]MBT2560859.1 hypothetical protein [Pedobacter sp. ISL-64]MBT2590249.1 hypothetical protein [Pedobacter sp. ISL-68]
MVIYSRAKQNIPITDIQADLRSITYNWMSHFNVSHYNGSWTVRPLRTPGGTDSIFPDLINADRFEDHPNMLLFPSVKAFTKGMQCEILSARMQDGVHMYGGTS